MTCNGMPCSFFPPSFLYQIQSPIQESLLPTINAQDLRGFASMPGKQKLTSIDEIGADNYLSDDCTHPEEKKRRLNLEQVKTLEESFGNGNKLEPERKMQLARELGLKPRQIAIWFQNRRARWKTKKMEMDYEALKRQFDALKLENEALLEQNKRLKAELLAPKGRDTEVPTINLNKETEGYSSSSDINLDISKPQVTDIESPQKPKNQAITFFPSFKEHNVSQFIHGCNSRTDIHCPKAENGSIVIGGQEENFCNIFGSIDEQSPSTFWTWSEHHNFR